MTMNLTFRVVISAYNKGENTDVTPDNIFLDAIFPTEEEAKNAVTTFFAQKDDCRRLVNIAKAKGISVLIAPIAPPAYRLIQPYSEF